MSTEQPLRHGWDTHVVLHYVSEERMEPYLRACQGNLDHAFDLYQWNIAGAGAILGVTAMVEVVVRNSIDKVLRQSAGQGGLHIDWFDLQILGKHGQDFVVAARRHAARNYRSLTHDRVLAELPFGFWRFLTSKRNLTSLWIPTLHQAFPLGDSDVWCRQQQVSRVLVDLNYARNRAAHLEPVFKRNLARDLAQAKLLMSWINPDVTKWLEDVNTINHVLHEKPLRNDYNRLRNEGE